MKEYELMTIIKPSLSEGRYEELVEKLRDIIVKGKGEILTEEVQGIREFAQTLQKLDHGYYVLHTFNADNAILDKLNNFFAVTEDVFRHLLIDVKAFREPA